MRLNESGFYAHYMAALQVTQEYNRVTDNDQRTSLRSDTNRRGIRSRGPLMAKFLTDYINEKKDDRIKEARVVGVRMSISDVKSDSGTFVMGRVQDDTVHFMCLVETTHGKFYLMDLCNAYTASKNCMQWMKAIAPRTKITIVGLSPIQMTYDIAQSFLCGSLVESGIVSFVTWQESDDKKGLFKVDLHLNLKVVMVTDLETVKRHYLYDQKKLDILLGIARMVKEPL